MIFKLDRTKEALAEKIKALERADLIIHVLSGWSGTARSKRNGLIMMAKYFNAFKLYKKLKQSKKQVSFLSFVLIF